jgi:hypothetical protein
MTDVIDQTGGLELFFSANPIFEGGKGKIPNAYIALTSWSMDSDGRPTITNNCASFGELHAQVERQTGQADGI